MGVRAGWVCRLIATANGGGSFDLYGEDLALAVDAGKDIERFKFGDGTESGTARNAKRIAKSAVGNSRDSSFVHAGN